MSTWKLSPSDLTFLWDECPRCFYLKVARGFNRPSAPFPSIFTRIDRLMKDFYMGKPTSELAPELPDGVVRFSGKWVSSQPISLPGHRATAFIRGIFDTVVSFSDGSFGVIDFKTTEPSHKHIDFYSRQLHAYAYALEHAEPGKFSLVPVTHLGLLCVEPVLMDRHPTGQVAYLGKVSWLEIPKDEQVFLSFLGEVLTLLESPSLPNSNPECTYCQYRDASLPSVNV